MKFIIELQWFCVHNFRIGFKILLLKYAMIVIVVHQNRSVEERAADQCAFYNHGYMRAEDLIRRFRKIALRQLNAFDDNAC